MLNIFKTIYQHLFLQKRHDEILLNLRIDLNKIKYFLELKHAHKKNDFLWFGDWDKKKKRISHYRKYNVNYNSIFQIYKKKKFFKDSDEYKVKSQLIKKGKKTARGNTINDLDNYFLSLDDLKNSLKRFGYLSQAQLKSKNKFDEIGVVIGRNGEIIKLEDKFGGTHRFALCKVLKINNIIVNIKAIHGELLNKKKNIEINNQTIKKELKKILNGS